jgi:hypothetical protein
MVPTSHMETITAGRDIIPTGHTETLTADVDMIPTSHPDPLSPSLETLKMRLELLAILLDRLRTLQAFLLRPLLRWASHLQAVFLA